MRRIGIDTNLQCLRQQVQIQTPALMMEVAVPHVLLLGSSAAGICIRDGVKN